MTFTPIIVGTGLVGYRGLVESRATQEARLSETAVVKRSTDNFAEKLAGIQSPADFVKDHDVMSVALGAFGLHDHISNRGLVQKVLESDLSDEESLAHTLEGGRFLALAEAFNFNGEGGPSLEAINKPPEAVTKLNDYNSASELLDNPSFEERKTIEATLKHFGLEKYAGNTFFLKQVMESDPSDPLSFANQRSDKNLVKLAEAFDFKAKQAELSKFDGTVYTFVEKVQASYTFLTTADDLINQPEMFAEALDLFGIDEVPETQEDLDDLRDILNSDLLDPDSPANQAEDIRYSTMAEAFQFHRRTEHAALIAATPEGEEPPEPFRGKLEKLVEAVEELDGKLEDVDTYFESVSLRLAAESFFDVKLDTVGASAAQKEYEFNYLRRVMSSDLSDPQSTANRAFDKRFQNLAEAFKIPPPVEDNGFTYPAGFADAIIDRYHSEEFLVAVGDTDPSMRFALSFEKGMKEILEDGSNESRWFSVIASVPLSEVFRTVFNLPTSFAGLDLDQQVAEFQKRAQGFFGTDNVADFGTAPLLDEVRDRYLSLSVLNNAGGGFGGNPILNLFAG